MDATDTERSQMMRLQLASALTTMLTQLLAVPNVPLPFDTEPNPFGEIVETIQERLLAVVKNL